MKINEVERLLNISAKAIRFYEDNELVVVNRDVNGYRNYSEENIQRLKEIKLYREMGIPLANIKEALDGKIRITDQIYKQIDKIDQLEERKKIYLKHAKDLEKGKANVDECLEGLSFLHTEEYQELKYRTLGGQVGCSLVLIIVILFGLYVPEELSTGYYGFSIVITVLLTVSWTFFIKEYEFSKNNILRDVKIAMKKIYLIVIFIIIGISLFLFFQLLQKTIFVPENFILLEFKYPYIYIPFLLFGELLIIIAAIFNSKKEMLDRRWMNTLYLRIKKYKKVTILVNVLLLYVCLTSVCIITDQKITDYSFYNPLGSEYSFDEVKKVETGFRGNKFGMSRNKGDFYYNITFSNHVSLSIENPYANERRYKDTYEEYIELDKLIMQYDVIKVSSDKNKEHISLDPKYKDMMLEVINNR